MQHFLITHNHENTLNPFVMHMLFNSQRYFRTAIVIQGF